MDQDNRPFSELPAALVDEMLDHNASVGEQLLYEFRKIKSDREIWRNALGDSGLLMSESVLGYPPTPTTSATDGSYAIERLLTCDFAAAAAVAMEGLTPPSEKRYWDKPHHKTFVRAEPHHAETATILRAVMMGNELWLATRAPHDVVMFDGACFLPIIYFNQALNAAPGVPDLACSEEFLKHAVEYLEFYLTFLDCSRTDKQYIAIPKYSTSREVGQSAGWPSTIDDRGILTLLMRAGELTKPLALSRPDQRWHISSGSLAQPLKGVVRQLASNIVKRLEDVRVFYYKPHDWLPALRVETSAAVTSNANRLALVVQGIKHQCATASMLEPYPLYLADRTVKALARALPTFRHVATQRVSEKYEGDLGEVFFALHSYRSETGTQ